jgi:hypothetical protein
MNHLRGFVQELIDQEASDHVFVTFGCDMAFTKAIVDFEHLDIIIDKFNENNKGIQMMYSTPQKYVDALKTVNSQFSNSTKLVQGNLTLT